jgi:hypothetical protein
MKILKFENEMILEVLEVRRPGGGGGGGGRGEEVNIAILVYSNTKMKRFWRFLVLCQKLGKKKVQISIFKYLIFRV